MIAAANDTLAALLDAFDAFVNTGAGTANFTVYQGNTSLAVFPLATTAFGSAVAGSLALASVPISSTGTEVAGTATRFIITNRNAATVATGTISAIGGGGDIETNSLTVTAAATQTLNALVVRATSNGALSVEGSLTLV